MNEEELDSIQELIERKLLMAEVIGGLTSQDKKFINLWNYAMKLQNNWNELKSRLQERIIFFEECDKELILSSYKKEIRTLKVVLDDMQELEQGKDE